MHLAAGNLGNLDIQWLHSQHYFLLLDSITFWREDHNIVVDYLSYLPSL